MRILRSIMLIIYLAATIGIPESLGLPGSGCHCANELQQAGQCCCAARGKSTGNCSADAKADSQEVSPLAAPLSSKTPVNSANSSRCPKCVSKPTAAVKTRPCCAGKTTDREKADSAKTDSSNTACSDLTTTLSGKPIVDALTPCTVNSLCSCGSNMPGWLVVEDPRLTTPSCTIDAQTLAPQLILFINGRATSNCGPPDTPPPKGPVAYAC